MVESQRCVFVGGLHRSGTTPLARAIAGHPQVSGLGGTGVKEDEGQHLQSVYPQAREFGGAGRFARDERAHLTENSPLVSPENAQRLWDAWSPYWDLSRPCLLEKSPPNLIMGRFLQALFPESAQVMVIRHPVVVALSTVKWRRLVSRNWQNHISLARMIEHWVIAHELMLADAVAIRRLHVLRYEDLVADPVGELAAIQELLGLESPISPGTLKSSHSDPYEDQWKRLGSGGWLSRRRRADIEDRFGDVVGRFGYDIVDLRRRAEWSITG